MVTATATSAFDISVPIGRAARAIRDNCFRLALLGLFGAAAVQAESLIQIPMSSHMWESSPAAALAEYWAMYVARLMLSYCITYLLYAALTHATFAAARGRPVSVLGCLGAALRDAPALFALAVLAVVSFYGGLFFLVVPGLFAITVFSVVVAVRTVERTPVLSTFTRSAELTLGNRWPIFGIFLAVLVLSYAANYLIDLVLILALTAIGMREWYPVAVRAAFGTTYVVFSVPIGVFAASLYYELRATKEGIGPERLAAVFD